MGPLAVGHARAHGYEVGRDICMWRLRIDIPFMMLQGVGTHVGDCMGGEVEGVHGLIRGEENR